MEEPMITGCMVINNEYNTQLYKNIIPPTFVKKNQLYFGSYKKNYIFAIDIYLLYFVVQLRTIV